MDDIWHRFWAVGLFTLALSENDHIGPQVAHKLRYRYGVGRTRVPLEWNYVETAMNQAASGAAGRAGDWFPKHSRL